MESGQLAYSVNDIRKAGGVFAREGQDYRSGMPYDGSKCPFGCPSAGTGLLDSLLENTLRMVGEVHVEIGQAMMNHGYRLNQAAQHYANSDAIAHKHIDDVYATAETKTLPPDLPQDGN